MTVEVTLEKKKKNRKKRPFNPRDWDLLLILAM